MERTRNNTVEVQVDEVRSGLERAKKVGHEEEKALRMRYGASVGDRTAPLARAAGNNEALADELVLMEMQLLRAFRARGAMAKGAKTNGTATVTAPVAKASNSVAAPSRAKDKIIRALRKKK
jgi:hypothetical protein